MSTYDKKTFTYGYELELGDIERDKEIPEHLGSWEYCETDVINVNAPYRGIACDPYGINPPVGGEINVKPTVGPEAQTAKIMETINLFDTPTASMVSHGHIHVSIPGLTDDIAALRQVTKYIHDNQDDTFKHCNMFEERPGMQGDPAKRYLKTDGTRRLPTWMMEGCLEANNFEEWRDRFRHGIDGVIAYRPVRYGINMLNLNTIGTIEFRCFRSSIDEKQISDSFKFVEEFMDAALNNPTRTVMDILADYDYEFPPFIYDGEMTRAWKATKFAPNQVKKRVRYEVE